MTARLVEQCATDLVAQRAQALGTDGISAPSVLSMDVVLAAGGLLQSGSAAATRHFGPDLTGMFTGDCGVLGIQATLRLPLLAARQHAEALWFTFTHFGAFHAGLRAAALDPQGLLNPGALSLATGVPPAAGSDR